MTTICFIAGLAIGLFIGVAIGGWYECALWLDAICGREKIFRGDRKMPPEVKP